jgi:hypothetical protein
MLCFLVGCSACLVEQATLAALKKLNRSKQIFILAASSGRYDYANQQQTFAQAAHQSHIDAYFLVLDTFSESLTPEHLSVPIIPVVIAPKTGRWIREPLTRAAMITFFNQHSGDVIPYIRAEDDLQFFFDTAGFGLVVAFRNASDETLPSLVSMYRDHFNEISIAYCDPDLTGREGFFVYRFNDMALEEVGQPLFGLAEEQVEQILSVYALPQIFKADVTVLPYLERIRQKIIFLALDTHGDFYLNPQQIDLAKSIKLQCGLTVVYETSMPGRLSSSRYGFPVGISRDELRVVDFETDPPSKYLMDEKLTTKNARKFCQAIKDGRAAKYYRSEPTPTIKSNVIEYLVADNVMDFVARGFSVVAVFQEDDSTLSPLVAAKQELVAKGLFRGLRLQRCGRRR